MKRKKKITNQNKTVLLLDTKSFTRVGTKLTDRKIGLSATAIGLFTIAISNQKDFIANKSDLRKRAKLGVASFKKAWAELVENGFIVDINLGGIANNLYIFSNKQLSVDEIEQLKNKFQLSASGIQHTVNSSPEIVNDKPIDNIDLINSDLSNEDLSNIEVNNVVLRNVELSNVELSNVLSTNKFLFNIDNFKTDATITSINENDFLEDIEVKKNIFLNYYYNKIDSTELLPEEFKYYNEYFTTINKLFQKCYYFKNLKFQPHRYINTPIIDLLTFIYDLINENIDEREIPNFIFSNLENDRKPLSTFMDDFYDNKISK
jgi:hypothetical protein